jgi:hypothetical protein
MNAKTVAPKVTVTGHDTDINGNDVYSVPSRSSSDVYMVVVSAGHATCCCKAAYYGRHCAHVAAVNEYRWRLAAKVWDTAPMYRSNAPFSLFKAV